jgi:hypothetical protein
MHACDFLTNSVLNITISTELGQDEFEKIIL